MKRFVNLLIILAIAIFIGWLAFGPSAPVTPTDVPPDQVKPGQEAFARALSTGIFYEQQGLLEQATASYQKAAEAAQPEIAAAASANLQRLAVQQKDFFFSLRQLARTNAQELIQALVVLILAVLIILFLWQLVGLLPRRPGYLLQPFNDLTPQAAGKQFHVQIARQLSDIHQTQSLAQDQLFNSLQRLDFPPVSPEWDIPPDILSLLDATKIGAVNLPLSGAIQAISKWLNRRAYSIEGIIEPKGQGFSVHLEIIRGRDQTQIQHWDVRTSGEGSPSDQLQAAAEEAAFRILFALAPTQVGANSWRSLQRFIKGMSLMQQGQDAGFQPEVLEMSRDALQDCLRIDPGNQLALFALGLGLITLGKYTEAQLIFERVIAWNTENTPLRLAALYNLGLACYHTYSRQRYERADAVFNEVLDHFKRHAPANEWSTSLAALAHCGLMSIEAQRLRPLLQEKISINRAEIEQRIHAHMQQANTLAGNRADVQAVIHFSSGIMKTAAGEIPQAVDEFKQSLVYRPDYIEAYIYLAILKFDQKEEDEAIRLLKQTEELKLPGNQYAMYRLGDIYEKLERPDAALNAYLLARDIPDARFASGKILAKSDDRLQALEEFRNATTLNSRNAEYWDYLAWTIIHPTLLDRDLLKEGMDASERMLQLVKGSSQEWRGRELIGCIAYYQPDLPRAVHELTLSVRLGEHKQNYYHLAAAWLASGNLNKARDAAIKALNISEPGQIWQGKAVALLHQIEGKMKENEPADARPE